MARQSSFTPLSSAADQNFSQPDDMTDIIFVVEDKEIHFNTAVLSISSPVFKAMFTSDFKEKEAKKIPLPGKKHEDMVEFFKQLHPMSFRRTPITEYSLKQILLLADEYQAKSVLDACEDFMGDNLRRGTRPATIVNYLLLCEQYNLTKQRAKLIERCAQMASWEFDRASWNKKLPQKLKWDILLQRCSNLENFVNDKVKPLVETLESVHNGEVSCSSSFCLCENCFKSNIPNVIRKLKPFP